MLRVRIRIRAFAAVLVLLMFLVSVNASAGERYALIVAGASGSPEHAERHGRWTAALSAMLIEQMQFDAARVTVLTDSADEGVASTAANVRRAVAAVRQRMTRDDLFFIILLGHGTFDGADAKFNLVGPDLDAAQWEELLADLPGRIVLANTTSASFPFIERLSGDRRIVITATDSAAQRFDTVFPEYFVQAFQDEQADIDKNGRISIWEAFTFAAARVRRHYEQRGQLATERPLLDDTGDGAGRDAIGAGEDGSSAARTYLDEPSPDAAPTDEVLLRLLHRRAALEVEVEELKIRRTFMPPDEYRKEFERLMIELARIGREVRQRVKS